MKAKDLLVVGLTALATMLGTWTLLGPTPGAHADQDEYKVVASITPVLATDTAELSLQTDKPVYRPGDKPVVTLKAVNHSDKPVSLKVKTRMLAMNPASRFSRMVTIPAQLWNHDSLVSLKPHETRTFTFETGAPVQKGKVGYFEIQAGNRTVTVAHFSATNGHGVQGAKDEGLANQHRRGAGTVAGRAAGDRS